MSYGKVKDTFWTDKKVRAFSDDAKMLALYLMTGPHRNSIGCMRVPTGYILEDLRWAPKRLDAAISALIENGFICRDEEGWTLICNQLKHDPIKIRNHGLAAITLANAVPTDSPVFHALKPRLIANLDTIGMASEWHLDPIATPIPSPLPEPLPEPEPEEGKATPAKPAAPPSDPDECDLAFDAWNDLAAEIKLPRVDHRSARRRKSLKLRLHECGGIEGWAHALSKIRGSPFLRGENDRGWKADFDFLLMPVRFTKLMEGGYDGTKSHGGRAATGGLTGAAAALAELAGEHHG